MAAEPERLAIHPPEDSKDGKYIVWAVRTDSLVAHPVFQPAVGRMVEPECDPAPFFASSMFGRKPVGLQVCETCNTAMFGGDQ